MVIVDHPMERYARLVAAYRTCDRDAAELARIGVEAAALAEAADSTWLRVQAGALAAAARAAAGGDLHAEAIVDASLPAIDERTPQRLDAILAGTGGLAERLTAHDVATRVPGDALATAAGRILRLLRDRAVEDLELDDPEPVELEVVAEAPWSVRLDGAGRSRRLLLSAAAAWTVEGLVAAIAARAYPGRHLAEVMRPPAPEWTPSPETTLAFGLAAVGREVVLADHELAHEIERIGNAVGSRWDGDRIVAVSRLRGELLPAVAAAALAAPQRDVGGALEALGVARPRVGRLIERWIDPLERASTLAEAAGPPLVRGWLETTGQTTGLRRLLGERLVPTLLRKENADAGG